jgi:diacylglycerol kinase family enzyme
MKHVLVLLNARAGTLLDIGTERIVGAIESALKPHCERLDIRLLKPRALGRAIADAAIGAHDTVIVGGGDGSVSARLRHSRAATRCSACCRSAP